MLIVVTEVVNGVSKVMIGCLRSACPLWLMTMSGNCCAVNVAGRSDNAYDSPLLPTDAGAGTSLPECNLRGGRYRYLPDLLQLESTRSQQHNIPRHLTRVVTPVRLHEWRRHLQTFPDRQFADYILTGFTEGFHVGFARTTRLHDAEDNMASTREHQSVVDEYLSAECALGRVVKLTHYERAVLSPHISPFGVIPKRGNKWRLILDLSSPQNHSVNDGIASPLCSLQYTKLDDAVRIIRRLGQGTQLAKMDLKSAYRIVPVHPEDRSLLGMQWRGDIYVDTALPFGLRSAPKIFSAVADALLWIMHSAGVGEGSHYLDDFLFLGPPAPSTQCGQSLQRALQVCQSLGVPVAPEKIVGPSTTLTFLGIEVYTIHSELRLPPAKVRELQQEVGRWLARQGDCTKRELLSLIGKLGHAATVIRPGRTFLRRMIDLSMKASHPRHRVHLRTWVKADLYWWQTLLRQWNGISLLPPTAPTHHLTSDASGSWGCGAYWERRWIQLSWQGLWSDRHITVKELLPIVLACALWGAHWRGQRILCHCDNEAVVFTINCGTSRSPSVMRLIRCLFFYCAYYQFTMAAVHLQGSCNRAADAISRNNIPLFRSLRPQALPSPDPVPRELRRLCMKSNDNWTSRHWRRWFASTLIRV